VDTLIGGTDRGTLWRSPREGEADRVVRVVEPRFCDGRFRHSLSGLQERPVERALPIVTGGWSSGDFRVEYHSPGPWKALGEHLADLPDWLARGAVLDEVCRLLPVWQTGPITPLGIGPRNVVVVLQDHGWQPWLVPCPPTIVETPCDLFGLEVEVVAELAPEAVRGLPVDGRKSDAYAVGTLVTHALGCAGTSGSTVEQAVEMQARGALLRPAVSASSIPPFLHGAAPVVALFEVIRRLRYPDPAGRLGDVESLRRTLAEAVDPLTLARSLAAYSPVHAVEVLSWAAVDPTRMTESGDLAALLHTTLGDHRAALSALDQAIAASPERLDLRARRADAAWEVYVSVAHGPEADRLGTVLVRELTMLRDIGWVQPKDTHHRLAEVHLRRGDYGAAAIELYAVAEADWADFVALLEYARCLIALREVDLAKQTVHEALRRIAQMENKNGISGEEASAWRARFIDCFPS